MLTFVFPSKTIIDTMILDTIIIGGSYAGLSAGMTLGRSLRNVLIIDAGKPCNRQTPHSHNFITHDGDTPAGIAAKAKQQVLQYDTVNFITGTVEKAEKTSKGFIVHTASGEIYNSKKLLFATGIFDILPAIEGLADCWGISVLHCPYCHGYEVRHQTTGIIGHGEAAIEYTKLLNNWTKELLIFTNGSPEFSTKQTELLNKTNTKVYPQEIQKLEHTRGQLTAIHFKDGG